MNQFGMDYNKVRDSASELKGRVAGMVTQAFAVAPRAAAAAAGVNRNYLTSMALIAEFAKFASAIETLNKKTQEHAHLLETSAQAVQDDDAKRAAREFNVETTFPNQRSTGSTHA